MPNTFDDICVHCGLHDVEIGAHLLIRLMLVFMPLPVPSPLLLWSELLVYHYLLLPFTC